VLLKQKSVPVADSLFIKAGYEQIKIIFSELLYLEGAGNYMSFIMADGRRIMSRLTITEVISLLPINIFVRVHRSYIVNKTKVDRIERHQLHIGKNVIPVGGAFDAGLLFGS
jgi:two-component system LytT family response regulator